MSDNATMNVLDRSCRAALAERLRSALRTLHDDPADGVPDGVEDALQDGLDRLRAWQAGRAVRRHDPGDTINPPEEDAFAAAAESAAPAVLPHCGAMSALVRTIERTGAGEPVAEFLLIPIGEVNVERALAGGSFVFTRAHAEAAVQWFTQLGRKLAIDYEHQTFDRFNTRPDGLRPAAGWIGRLEARDDGLWATAVEWTARAADLIRSGEYRYFSPVILWRDEDYSELAGLGPVALTNDPAMRGVAPLAARRGATLDADECDSLAGSERDEFSLNDTARLRLELRSALDETAVLRKQLRMQEADAFIERGLRLGKIVDSNSMDWRADFLRDAEATELRLARAPVLLPPGRVIRVDARGEVVPAPLRPRLTGVDAEDLAAFEAANAAGRVRFFGN